MKDLRQMNLYWKKRIKWNDWAVELFESDFDLFIKSIKNIQKSNKLLVDGILGPKTLFVMTRESLKWENSIVIGGERKQFENIIINFDDHVGFSFYERGGWRQRKYQPNLIVLHWTVTFTAHSTFRVLSKRGLSTHFIIDADGKIYQCLDPIEAVAFHAGWTNDFSIGIDLVNPVMKKYAAKEPERPLIETKKANSWKTVQILDYTPKQKKVLPKFLKELCKLCDIQYAWINLYNCIDKKSIKGFNGILGHYHISKTKWDPGTHIWSLL